MFNKNSGYVGSSMSVRAVAAYQGGEKPKSKWTKSEILSCLGDFANEFRKISTPALKEVLLEKSSWHHTGSYFNCTDFYSMIEIEEANICELVEKCQQISNSLKSEKSTIKLDKAAQQEKLYEVKYVVWEGTYRRYRRPVEYTETCKVIGNWAHTKNGRKSKFEIIREVAK